MANQLSGGGSIPAPSLHILPYQLRNINLFDARIFVEQHHYSSVLPRLNKLCLGGYRNDELKAVMTLGWGVRPLHTIRKLFPSLAAKDYFEIGKLCLVDEEPKNSESKFIKQVIWRLKKEHSQIKVLFTWADAMWGKPGYIYQASNFLYGGFIWTDVYCDAQGKRIHPRQLRAARAQHGEIGTARPSEKDLKKFGWKHYFGKQFRYVYFLDKTVKQKLLDESTVPWTTHYPKHADLEWKQSIGNGKRISCAPPQFSGAYQSKHG